MKNSTIEELDTASVYSDAGMASIKNKITFIVASALLLVATNAMATITIFPADGHYSSLQMTPVIISSLSDETIRVHTSGLTGELTIQGSSLPPEYDIATTTKVVLPFDQKLDLVIDVSEGTVSGHASMDMATPYILIATSEVRGKATCLPFNGRVCGQLVLDLEIQGVLSDPNDPSIVGKLHSEILGSLIWDDTDHARWSAMSGNATIGGNEELINSYIIWELGKP